MSNRILGVCVANFSSCVTGIVKALPEVAEEESIIILKSFRDYDWAYCISQQ